MNTQTEVAANVAQLPTSGELSEKLALLTSERDKAEKTATDAHNAIQNCKTGADIQAAVGEATSAANRHETLIRAAERVQSELAATTSREFEQDQARQAAEVTGLLIELATQAHAQKLTVEETVLKLAQDIEDRVLNALDELAEVKSAHRDTVTLYNNLKRDTRRFSFENPGQVRTVPTRTVVNEDGHALVLLEHTTTDYVIEEARFVETFADRGINFSAVQRALEPNAGSATHGMAKFIFDLALCQSRGKPLRAEFSNAVPVRTAPANYASLNLTPVPPAIAERYDGKGDETAWDVGPEPQGHPELFHDAATPETIEARQVESQERADQLEAQESQERRESDRQLLDGAQAPPLPAQDSSE